MIEPISAVLILEDGSIYRGWSLSAAKTVVGEIVFNTGMTGYQEILTDPSYCGQIIVFTYPELGNTGVNSFDAESNQVFAQGIIAKNICKFHSNWRSKKSLIEYLQLNNIINIYGLDTRKLTKHLRDFGSMNGIISNESIEINVLQQRVKLVSSMEGLDLVCKVTAQNRYSVEKPINKKRYFYVTKTILFHKTLRIIVIDFGTKMNILRRLQQLNCEVIVVPASTRAEKILCYKPSGIVLPNGPGDPSTVSYAIKTINKLLQHLIPVFGICMGHQLLGLALGCNTYKLKFGHRGLNHPSGLNQKVYMTSQNHGFAINSELLPVNLSQLIHINFNDHTIAGISHKTLPIFSVQYHPESSPGPHDTDYLFAYFIRAIYEYNIIKCR